MGIGGLGWGLGLGFQVFHMRNKCLFMSKYPLGSNFGGTGDSGGDWGFRVGIGYRVFGLRYLKFLTYVFLCQSIL